MMRSVPDTEKQAASVSDGSGIFPLPGALIALNHNSFPIQTLCSLTAFRIPTVPGTERTAFDPSRQVDYRIRAHGPGARPLPDLAVSFFLILLEALQ
jgi:hypothetical protein